jgi:hypothetical protein
MCTVTYIPTVDGFCLTSNRDENSRRGRAQAPALYSAGTSEVIYPKDSEAGGSWVVLKEKGTAAVLLNGAFLKHLRTPPYRLSRGLVLLDIVRQPDPLEYLAAMNLEGIEPFTVVLYSGEKLWDCRWDGKKKHIHSLDQSVPHIWSSATLYDQSIANQRRQWFENWLGTKEQVDPADIVDFHQKAGNGDRRTSLVMNRDDEMYTVSVTSVVVKKKEARMFYHDLRTGERSVARFNTVRQAETAAAKSGRPNRLVWSAKKFLTRLTRWEFWPTHLIYAPVYPYWLWLSLRARSFFFFNAANPQIENAGFTHERKSDIYRQLPGRFYPRTHYCPLGTDFEVLKKQLANRALNFPLIAKPDIGERGTEVSLLRSAEELAAYYRRARVDFLVQEYVSYEMEAGIFYVRIPGESKGRITGIVGKEFLSITGDGRNTVRQLLMREPRSRLQLDVLAEQYGHFLDITLADGVRQILVPYGNHCRGAKFIDRGEMITDELEKAIDNICRRIPDFYFGRLDLKFASWQDLAQEKNFSIIEVNGAGSEPTHIYDPEHSLFFAWKEIARHWRLLYRVSLANAKRRNIPLMNTREGLQMLAAHSRHLKMINAC